MRGEIGVVHLSEIIIQEKCDRNMSVFIKSHKFYKLFLKFVSGLFRSPSVCFSIAFFYESPLKTAT